MMSAALRRAPEHACFEVGEMNDNVNSALTVASLRNTTSE